MLIVSRYLCFCFLLQAWRDRYGAQEGAGRSRAGYTEINDDQSSPVTETKNSGKDSKKWHYNGIENVSVLLTATPTKKIQLSNSVLLMAWF